MTKVASDTGAWLLDLDDAIVRADAERIAATPTDATGGHARP